MWSSVPASRPRSTVRERSRASDPRALVHDEGIVVAGLNVLEEDLEAEGVRPIRGGESKDDENAPVHVLGTADDVNMI